MPDPQQGAPRARRSVLPSLNFLLILLVFAGTGAALWNGVIGGRFFVFVFVIAGWVVSLCLHEFAHAITACYGGDYGMKRSGYLDLDPLRYSDPALSLILPIAYILLGGFLLGGFGLPGGAVYINMNRLRGRGWMSAVSVAGPLASLAFLALLAILYAMLPEGGSLSDVGAGLGVLALFQATAIVLNLLPFPGLDGFGILSPFLPRDVAARAETIGGAAFLILFLLIWLTPAGAMLIRVGVDICRVFGFDVASVAIGFGMMKLF